MLHKTAFPKIQRDLCENLSEGVFLRRVLAAIVTAPKMKFSINLRSFLRIWSLLLKKSLMENFIVCAVRTACKLPEERPLPCMHSCEFQHR